LEALELQIGANMPDKKFIVSFLDCIVCICLIFMMVRIYYEIKETQKEIAKIRDTIYQPCVLEADNFKD
jgi:cell division protein FtsL